MNALAICLLLATVYVTDAYLFSIGHNTFFHEYKTADEKAAQKRLLDLRGKP